MSLQYYIDEFSKIRMNKSGGQTSPHKACLLLAVMRMVEEETLENNRINFNDHLIQEFSMEMEKLSEENLLICT